MNLYENRDETSPLPRSVRGNCLSIACCGVVVLEDCRSFNTSGSGVMIDIGAYETRP